MLKGNAWASRCAWMTNYKIMIAYLTLKFAEAVDLSVVDIGSFKVFHSSGRSAIFDPLNSVVHTVTAPNVLHAKAIIDKQTFPPGVDTDYDLTPLDLVDSEEIDTELFIGSEEGPVSGTFRVEDLEGNPIAPDQEIIIRDPEDPLPLLVISGYWLDTKEPFEGYLVKQTDDGNEEEEDSIFYYGLSIEAARKSINKITAEDWVITSVKLAS